MTTRTICPSCNDGCEASIWCEGCDDWVCGECYDEHNDDAEDHEPDERAIEEDRQEARLQRWEASR